MFWYAIPGHRLKNVYTSTAKLANLRITVQRVKGIFFYNSKQLWNIKAKCCRRIRKKIFK